MPEDGVTCTNVPNKRLRLRASPIISLCFGFLLIFAVPYGAGYFKDWLIPLAGSYRINLFEAFAMPVIYGGLIYYGIRIKKYEQILFLSIILTILSRIISLLAADGVQVTQWISIFRYVETLALVYICANLFSNQRNRHFFTIGVIIGVAIETVGGIFVFLIHDKGIFISTSSFMLQVFLIITCILAFINKKHRFLVIVLVLTMVLATFATLTRAAWIFLMTSVLMFVLVYLKKQILKNILLFSGLTGMIILLLGNILPYTTTEIFASRMESALGGEGSVLYRFYLWDMAIASFLQHPIVGIGSGSFGRQQEHLPKIFHVELPAYYAELDIQLSTHNTFLGVLSETGMSGLAAYLLWIIAVTGICRKIFRLSNIYCNNDKYVIAASIIVISSVIGDVISQYSFMPISSAFIGFALGWLRERINY